MTRNLFAIPMLLVSFGIMADTMNVPVSQGASTWQGETPRRGSTKAIVQSKFGSPTSIAGPRGTPPIYFWEYDDFTVYFESDHVIHTVVKHRPNQQS